MDVTAESFRPAPIPNVRRLTVDDAPFVAAFFGAPPQAAESFRNWLQGAKALMGAFEEDALQALGSTAMTLPEVWGLIAIETRPEARGRGFATQVTSALTQFALEQTPVVTLTMVTDNTPARKVYERLGYRTAQNRVWIDVGTGSTP
jgi:RimJ/RimL family protein N-acetyltransferase